jgi:hypothetical protein
MLNRQDEEWFRFYQRAGVKIISVALGLMPRLVFTFEANSLKRQAHV